MSSEVIEVVREFIAAVNRRSPSDIGKLMSEDFTFIDSQGGAQTGREPMIAAWKAYFEMFPDYEICAESVIADGGLVALFGTASGTFKGARGLRPENRIVMPAAWKAMVRGEFVASWQVYADWSEGMKIIEREQKKG